MECCSKRHTPSSYDTWREIFTYTTSTSSEIIFFEKCVCICNVKKERWTDDFSEWCVRNKQMAWKNIGRKIPDIHALTGFSEYVYGKKTPIKIVNKDEPYGTFNYSSTNWFGTKLHSRLSIQLLNVRAIFAFWANLETIYNYIWNYLPDMHKSRVWTTSAGTCDEGGLLKFCIAKTSLE